MRLQDADLIGAFFSGARPDTLTINLDNSLNFLNRFGKSIFMASYTIDIEETFDLPREKVFAVFADHETFGKLLGAPVKRVRESDQADPNGIGSVRKVGIGPLSIEETVVGFEPESLIEYTITSTSPLRHHMGRIRFDQDVNGHSRVTYTITFEDVLPFTGVVIQKALEQAIRKGIKRVPKFV